MTGGFRKTNIPADIGIIYFFLEIFFHLLGNLTGQAKTGIEHGHQHPLDRELRIKMFSDNTDGIEQLAKALKRIIFRLYGNQHRISGSKRVERNQSE